MGKEFEMIGVEQLKRVQHSEVRGVTDPLELLVECHRKLERHLDALLRAAEVVRAGSDAERLSAFLAIDMARAHFYGPLVKHTEDEEQSLFPRLRRRGGIAAAEALAAVGELEAEHRAAELLHREFDGLADRIPRDGSAGVGELEELNRVVAALASLYRPHVRVENELVFPAASRILTVEDSRQIGAEMQARRALHLHRY